MWRWKWGRQYAPSANRRPGAFAKSLTESFSDASPGTDSHAKSHSRSDAATDLAGQSFDRLYV